MDVTPPDNQEWIAIEPPRQATQPCQTSACEHFYELLLLFSIIVQTGCTAASSEQTNPPSFRESQFDIILRRKRPRPGLKINNVPSRFLNLSHDFEFAGWGSITYLKLTPEDIRCGEEMVRSIGEQKILGQFLASGLAGNDILGGVFYTLPAVVAVASV